MAAASGTGKEKVRKIQNIRKGMEILRKKKRSIFLQKTNKNRLCGRKKSSILKN